MPFILIKLFFGIIAITSPSWLVASELTIGDLAMNTAANLPPFTSMITGFAYIMGLAFLISGLFKLKRHAEQPQQVPLLAPIIFITMGAFLIYLPTTVSVLRDTMFAGSSTLTGMDVYQSKETMDGTKANSGSST